MIDHNYCKYYCCLHHLCPYQHSCIKKGLTPENLTELEISIQMSKDNWYTVLGDNGTKTVDLDVLNTPQLYL